MLLLLLLAQTVVLDIARAFTIDELLSGLNTTLSYANVPQQHDDEHM